MKANFNLGLRAQRAFALFVIVFVSTCSSVLVSCGSEDDPEPTPTTDEPTLASGNSYIPPAHTPGSILFSGAQALYEVFKAIKADATTKTVIAIGAVNTDYSVDLKSLTLTADYSGGEIVSGGTRIAFALIDKSSALKEGGSFTVNGKTFTAGKVQKLNMTIGTKVVLMGCALVFEKNAPKDFSNTDQSINVIVKTTYVVQ